MPRNVSIDPRLFRDPQYTSLSFEQRMEFIEFVRTADDPVDEPSHALDREAALKLLESLANRGLISIG